MIEIWCKNENHNFYKTKFNNFKNGKRCQKCKGEKSSCLQSTSIEYIKKYVESYDFKLIDSSRYKNRDSKISIECNNGHVFETTFGNFKRRDGKNKCTKCSNRDKFEYNYVKSYVESYNRKLLSTEYNKNNEDLKILCLDCNNEFYNSFEVFRNSKNKCPYCSGLKISYNQIVDYMNSINYSLISNEYKNNRSNLIIKCDKGHIFENNLSNIKKGSRCPYCKKTISKGERETKNILYKYNIDNIYQHIFDDCRNTRPLPFDFYLPKYNCCIEYDGRQHYKIGCFNMTLLDLMNIKFNDKKKTRYCLKNNIPLLRIPYWDFNNIEQILIKQLNLNNLDTKLK